MTIKLFYTYLAHDVKQLTTRYAEARTKEPDLRDLAQLGDGESDKELIMRLIVTGVSRLKRVLKGKIRLCAEDSNDILPTDTQEKGRPVIDSWSFDFDNNNSDADGESLAGLMHWLVVRFAITEWCRMFSPADMGVAKQETQDVENEIDELLSGIAMPLKERTKKNTEDWPAEIVYSNTPIV